MNMFRYSSEINELERCLLMLGTQLSCMVINTQGRCHANKAIACSSKWQFSELVSLSLSLNLDMLQIFLIKCSILRCEVSRLMPLCFCWIKMTRSAMKQKVWGEKSSFYSFFFPLETKMLQKLWYSIEMSALQSVCRSLHNWENFH